MRRMLYYKKSARPSPPAPLPGLGEGSEMRLRLLTLFLQAEEESSKLPLLPDLEEGAGWMRALIEGE